jgi:hypothetical protein
MVSVEDDDVIETFAADAADESFHVRGLPGAAGSDEDFFDAHVLDAAAEEIAVNGVPVTNQETGRRVFGKSLDDLLGGPAGSGVFGDVEVNHHSPVKGEHEENEEHLEADGRDGEEVDASEISEVIVQKGPPGRGGWLGMVDCL